MKQAIRMKTSVLISNVSENFMLVRTLILTRKNQ